VNGMIDHFFQGSRDKFLIFMGREGEAEQEDHDDRESLREIAGPASLDETLL